MPDKRVDEQREGSQSRQRGHLAQADTKLGPAAPPCGKTPACFSLHYTLWKTTGGFGVLPLEGGGVKEEEEEEEGGGEEDRGGGRKREREKEKEEQEEREGGTGGSRQKSQKQRLKTDNSGSKALGCPFLAK